ncbi:MAG TPA: hypothetical protein VMV15_05425 [Candidatus Binataceae bacterium]|nr:hypothetical protein [Candidatus Binataceae bacterium]
MRSPALWIAAAAVAMLTVGVSGCRPQTAATPATSTIAPLQTQVIVFKPAVPADVEEGGRCWTDSIAVSRPGAWRCMRENFIYDPCFEVSGQPRQVVCGADPAKGDHGFLLKLTEPLPAPAPSSDKSAQPWLIELADGSICQAATGTMAAIEGESVRYPCSGPKSQAGSQPVYTGLLGTMYPGKVWSADQVWFTVEPTEAGLPFKLLKRETVAIRRLWE